MKKAVNKAGDKIENYRRIAIIFFVVVALIIIRVISIMVFGKGSTSDGALPEILAIGMYILLSLVCLIVAIVNMNRAIRLAREQKNKAYRSKKIKKRAKHGS